MNIYWSRESAAHGIGYDVEYAAILYYTLQNRLHTEVDLHVVDGQ